MNELRKALLSMETSSTGEVLSPEDLEPILVEYLGRQMPLWNFIPKAEAFGKSHEFNVRTDIPSANFEGELTGQNASSSKYERRSVQLKIIRQWGGVSGFTQTMSQRFINSLEAELVGSVEAMANTIEYGLTYGNDADPYQFNGLDTFITRDATASKSINNGGNVLSVGGSGSLDHLDAMIDQVETYRGTLSDQKIFLMTPQMISYVSGLQTRINREVQTVEFEGGFRMATYRGIPLYPSGFLKPLATTTSPTVTATAAAGGTMEDGTYYYAISSVSTFGEQVVGTADNASTATTNNSVKLTWTPDPSANLYKIWRGSSNDPDDMQLLTVISAKTRDTDGSVNGNVAEFIDDGSYDPIPSVQPLADGEETVFLANISDANGIKMLGKINVMGEPVANWLSYVPLATRKSALEYFLEAFMAVQVPYPTLHAVARRIKPGK